MDSAVGMSSKLERSFQGVMMTTHTEMAPTPTDTSSAPTRCPWPTRPGTSIWPGVMKMAKMISTMTAPTYTTSWATARKSAPSKAYISATPPRTVVSASAARIRFLMLATIMYAAAMLAIALTQNASVPTKVVSGSVVPSMRPLRRRESCCAGRRLPAAGFEAGSIDLAALGGGQLLQVFVADGQRVVVGRGRGGGRGGGSRARGGSGGCVALAARHGCLRRGLRLCHLGAGARLTRGRRGGSRGLPGHRTRAGG